MESSLYRICVTNPRGIDTGYLRDITLKLVINSDNMDDPDLSKSIATAEVYPLKEKLRKTIEKVK